jgi:hypothetical protein
LLSVGGSNEYGDDDFEDEGGAEQGDVMPSPIRNTGVEGVRQLARSKLAMAMAESEAESGGLVGVVEEREIAVRRKKAKTAGTKGTQMDDASYNSPLYWTSKSAPLLPSLATGAVPGSTNQQAAGTSGRAVKRMTSSASAAGEPRLPSHHPYYRNGSDEQVDDGGSSCVGGAKKRRKKKKADLPAAAGKGSGGPKKKGTAKKSADDESDCGSVVRKNKRLPVLGDVRSPYSHDRPSCAECGFHFVGTGMKLPTTLQKKESRSMDSDDEGSVGAGYNSHHTSSSLIINKQAHSKHHGHGNGHGVNAQQYPHGKPAQLAVRELYGARRGDGCVFCSWSCAREWNHKHTPVQLKYQTDQLITIASIQQEDDGDNEG